MPSIMPCSAVGVRFIKSVKAAFASIRACSATASLLWISPGGTTIPGPVGGGSKPVIEVPGQTPISDFTMGVPMTVAPVLVIELVGEDGEARCLTEVDFLRLGIAGQSGAHKAKRCGAYEEKPFIEFVRRRGDLVRNQSAVRQALPARSAINAQTGFFVPLHSPTPPVCA